MNREEEKVRKMKLKAKEHIDNGNKKSAQTICREMVDKEKKISNIVTRKHLLENQITQLEYNEMNKNTITLIEEANQIYEQTMIDPNKMDELVYFCVYSGRRIWRLSIKTGRSTTEWRR